MNSFRGSQFFILLFKLLYITLGNDFVYPGIVFLALFIQHFNVVLFRLAEYWAWKVKRSVVINLISILEVDELSIWAGLIMASTPVTLSSSALISSAGSATASSATTSEMCPSSGHLLNVTSFWCRR